MKNASLYSLHMDQSYMIFWERQNFVDREEIYMPVAPYDKQGNHCTILQVNGIRSKLTVPYNGKNHALC